MELTPQRWTRIKEICYEALDLDDLGRAEFIKRECAGDEALGAEVERLVVASKRTGGLLEQPLFQKAPEPETVSCVPGGMISHYRIVDKLGEGGMGVVYHAVDTRLSRPVAIKMLTPGKFNDPDRKRRFIQEAKTASSLNHPNIITIYESGTHGDADYIVMEYIAGKTLRQTIPRKGLPPADALHYAIQVAGALAAAHRAGIVHRDLKPANIMVTEDGSIKVLDFGLAKLTESAPPGENEETLTMEAPLTREGVIFGTVSYMSPEQAEGKKVDSRSDVFSFGSVLYEMLTGRRAFHGASTASILSDILHRDPAAAGEVVKGLPRELDRVISWCLRKKPERRVQHLDDLKLWLEELKEDVESGHLASAPALPAGVETRRWLWPIVALVAALAGFVIWRQLRPAAPRTEPVITRLTSDFGLSAFPALSGDGRMLAYASDRGAGNLEIWVQQIGGLNALRLTSHEADDYDPAISHDGTQIAFRSERDGGGIYLIRGLGGQAGLIASKGRSPRFSPNGRMIAYWVGEYGAGFAPGSARIYVMDLSGGQPQAFQPQFGVAMHPVWSPDGSKLLFLGRRDLTPQIDWWVASIAGGQPQKTGALPLFRSRSLSAPTELPAIVPEAWRPDTGEVVFSASLGDTTNLWQLPLSTRTGAVAGEPARTTLGTGIEMHAATAPAGGGKTRTVYSSLVSNVDVWSLPADVNQGKVTGEAQRITQDFSADAYPSISADGKKLVFVSARSGNLAVWIRDMSTGVETLLATPPSDLPQPRISGDGSRVVYWRQHEKENQGFMLSSAGGSPAKFCDACGVPTHVSSDGRSVLTEDVGAPDHIILVDADSGRKVDLTPGAPRRRSNLYGGRFSADGRWISFHGRVGDSVNRQIFIAPFRPDKVPDDGEWIAVTDGSALDRETYWSPDGSLLYFLSDRDGFRCIWAIRLDPATKRSAGQPFAVHHLHQARRSLARVGPTPGAVSVSVARDRIVFALGELTGNIWMTTK